MHFVSDKSLERPGYRYENGVGYPDNLVPHVNWKHIDGPLLYTTDAGLHWLTYWERIKLFFGLTDIHTINRKRLRIR